jgi:demethylmenaquinone methyltransferase/2-methoxy-6-polyprenyl-1,4-benzoquinol methylase
MTTVDQPLPVAGGAAKRAYVRQVFQDIAPRYDALNHVLSLNADRGWRRAAVNALRHDTPSNGTYLDLCAGTLDLSAELANRRDFTGRVVATDFVTAMLRLGRGKAARVAPATADALTLPFADAAFDGAMVGFGVRNLMDLDAGLREAARVLKPGARFVVLEFTTPHWQPFRAIYLAYLQQVLPRIGRMVSKHRTAYQWLPASVLPFPEPPALAQRLAQAGFQAVTWQTLWGGIVAIHIATRATA